MLKQDISHISKNFAEVIVSVKKFKKLFTKFKGSARKRGSLEVKMKEIIDETFDFIVLADYHKMIQGWVNLENLVEKQINLFLETHLYENSNLSELISWLKKCKSSMLDRETSSKIRTKIEVFVDSISANSSEDLLEDFFDLADDPLLPKDLKIAFENKALEITEDLM